MGLHNAYTTLFANSNVVNKIVAEVCMDTDQTCSVMIAARLLRGRLTNYLLVVHLRRTKPSLVVGSNQAWPRI